MTKLDQLRLHQVRLLLIFAKGRRQDKQGYIWICLKKNLTLKKALENVNFFAFHYSNNKLIVGEHQIICFLNQGYLAYQQGFTASKGELEVHHINSCPNDNRPENLIYLSSEDHKIVSQASNTRYLGFSKSPHSTPFNRRGRAIQDSKNFLVRIIQETIRETMKCYDILFNVDNPLILMNLPYWLHEKFSNFSWDICSQLRELILHKLDNDKTIRLIQLQRFIFS